MNLFMNIMYYVLMYTVYIIHTTYIMRLYAMYIYQTKNLDFGFMIGATDSKYEHFKY